MSRQVRNEIARWVVLAVLALGVVWATGLSSRDVYSKSEVDSKIEKVEEVRDVQFGEIKEDLLYIRGRVDQLAGEEVTPDG